MPAAANNIRIAVLLQILCMITVMADEKNPLGLSQVVDARGKILGTYGGLMLVSSESGQTVAAFIVITRTGHLLPVTPQGEFALFRSAYFANEDCTGVEYLSTDARQNGGAPLAGVIYRSLATSHLRYIPRYSGVQISTVSSRMYLDEQNVLKCEALRSTVNVLRSEENDPLITGYEHGGTQAIAVALQPAVNARGSQGGFSRISADGSQETEQYVQEQLECSPGCLIEDTGNEICEISCYVEACFFDRGDCADRTPTDLQQDLAQMCSPGCLPADLGDSFCDEACNNAACEFDRGDCGN